MFKTKLNTDINFRVVRQQRFIRLLFLSVLWDPNGTYLKKFPKIHSSMCEAPIGIRRIVPECWTNKYLTNSVIQFLLARVLQYRKSAYIRSCIKWLYLWKFHLNAIISFRVMRKNYFIHRETMKKNPPFESTLFLLQYMKSMVPWHT